MDGFAPADAPVMTPDEMVAKAARLREQARALRAISAVAALRAIGAQHEIGDFGDGPAAYVD